MLPSIIAGFDTEIIQGIAGSIGIILTVPLTALVSVLFIEQGKETKVLKNGANKLKNK